MFQTFSDYVGPTGHGCENWWRRSGVFLGGGNAKAGGPFPRNGKDAVWKAGELEDTHGRFLLHDRRGWTFCSSGEGCAPARVMGSLWLKTHTLCTHKHTHTKTPPLTHPPDRVVTLPSGLAGLTQLDFIPVCLREGNSTACAGSIVFRAPRLVVHCQFPQGVTVSFQQASHKSMIKPDWETAAVFGRREINCV